MAGLFGSVTIKGNRLTDLVGQTSSAGKPIPFGYGRCRITEPNVIWTSGVPKEHVKKKKQGKGGVKTEEYTYTLSYAIAFMEGPTFGYLTIKRGGKIVYTTDPNASVDDKAYAAKWLQKAKLYSGTRTQLPDATIESYVGVGKVSAFRDLAYIVVTDDDVTSEGGAVPQYEAIIIATPPEAYLTSLPYPQYQQESNLNRVAPAGGDMVTVVVPSTVEPESFWTGVAPTGGYLVTQEPPALDAEAQSISVAPTGGTMNNVLKIGTAESSAQRSSVAPTGGVLKAPPKGNLPADDYSIKIAPTGGTLTTI